MAENQFGEEYRKPGETPGQPPRPQDEWDAEALPPKSGMSGGMKAFLIVAAILGCCCVLCCGVFGFFAYSFYPKVSQNPADINAAKDEIAKIDIPAGFTPAHMIKMDNFIMTMTAVGYTNPAIDGAITLAEMRLKVGEAAQRDQAMRQQLDRQGFGSPKRLTNVKSETKHIEIKGQECDFTFKRGDDPGTRKKIHQVSGVFEGNKGPVLVSIEMDDSAYKEDAVVKMLESIK